MLDTPLAVTSDRNWERRLAPVGLHVLRYGLILLLAAIGTMKFFEFEAIAIRPLVENHPLMSWMYGPFGLRGTSAIIGTVELVTAALMLTRHWRPRLSGYGSLLAAGTFVLTLSFLLTTPNPPTGFLMKDLILLGAALYTAGEAFAAAARGTRR